ncbi:MAG: hypothetical protein F6J93_28310 [Oscillatoria sp. SIO1A7]|nr:hypothetical protein [Oscillatoria sp. SIO1A7]
MKQSKTKASCLGVFTHNFSSIKYIVASSIVGSAIAYNPFACSPIAMANTAVPNLSSELEVGAAIWELQGIELEREISNNFDVIEENTPLVQDLSIVPYEEELKKSRQGKKALNAPDKGGSMTGANSYNGNNRGNNGGNSIEANPSRAEIKQPNNINIFGNNLGGGQNSTEGFPVIDYRELMQMEPALESRNASETVGGMAGKELPRWEISQKDAGESEEALESEEAIESDEALRQELLIPELPVTLTPSTLGAAASPGSSSGSPTAFGANFGNFFMGASFQERTRFTDSSDGSISAGFGLGDSRKSVGLEVAVSVLDLSTRGGDNSAFDRGSFSFKLHKALPNNLAVAVGYENGIVWGFTDAGSSVYGVVSKIFQLQDSASKPFSSLTVSAGIGNGRFRSEDDFNDDRGTVNAFGSVGLRVVERVSAIADWTGQDLTLGASLVPFRNLPIVVTPAVSDITGSAGDGARFILGVGYSRSFSF